MPEKDKTRVVKSYVDEGVYFIFRDNGQEVKVLVNNGVIKADHYRLTQEEINYFETNVIAKYGIKQRAPDRI